jgi:hypothetical protein
MEALARVQRLEKRQGVVERTGRFGTAFKTLLALGSTMADVSAKSHLATEGHSAYLGQLDPTGGAKVAFSVCTKAWEVCGYEQILG